MIPISKPYLGNEEVEAAKKVILSGWVTQGPKVKEFEDNFSAYVGSKYATAVSSGTTALHLALEAVGVKPGNIVITVSHSFIATANCVRYCLAEPAFVDIDFSTFNMSPESLKSFIEKECVEKNSKLYYKKAKEIAKGESPLSILDKNLESFGEVTAVLVAHQIGMPADIKALKEITDKYSLPLIEDAACAIGSEYSLDGGKTFEKVGKPHGDIACFSFHPRKVLTTGDGGMITTNKPEYDERFKLLRQHSMVKPAVNPPGQIAATEFPTTGFNYRMTDIQASVGIEQLKKMPEIIQKRKEIDGYYRKHFKDITWLKLPVEPDYAKSNWQSYALTVLKGSPVSRNELMIHLLDNKVASLHGIMNAHQCKPYSNSEFNLPESERANNEVILLPFYQTMDEETVKQISDIVRQL